MQCFRLELMSERRGSMRIWTPSASKIFSFHFRFWSTSKQSDRMPEPKAEWNPIFTPHVAAIAPLKNESERFSLFRASENEMWKSLRILSEYHVWLIMSEMRATRADWFLPILRMK
jgi:hypothetical protein